MYVRGGLYINGEIACGDGEGPIHQSELSVICELGRGACGVVKKMQRLWTNECYAVKVRERGVEIETPTRVKIKYAAANGPSMQTPTLFLPLKVFPVFDRDKREQLLKEVSIYFLIGLYLMPRASSLIAIKIHTSAYFIISSEFEPIKQYFCTTIERAHSNVCYVGGDPSIQ